VSCFKGIVATELFRLLRTNETCKDYEFQCGFFLQKLRYRGYPAKFCSNIFKRFPWTSKNAILNRASSIPTEKQQRKIIGFRIRYCFGIDTVGITSVLHDCSDILPNDFLCKVKFITSYSIALNNFRSRYNRFLWDHVFRSGVVGLVPQPGFGSVGDGEKTFFPNLFSLSNRYFISFSGPFRNVHARILTSFTFMANNLVNMSSDSSVDVSPQVFFASEGLSCPMVPA
jgi:hypothetical protein